jgi:hypothetical protein
VKHLAWDLHFDTNGVRALTPAGEVFLVPISASPLRSVYEEAISNGMHASFESAEIRNQILDEMEKQ